MPHDEFVMLGVGLVALGIALGHRSHLARIRRVRLLAAGFIIFGVGWTATVLEHYAFPAFFNVVEHSAYLLGAVAVACWCWMRDRTAAEPR